MPFWRTYYHLVWGTKDRSELIGPEVEETLFRYLVKKAAELNVRVFAINGWYDHVHLVVSIPPKHSIATVAKHLKGSSSHYLNIKKLSTEPFAWQRGYGVFTLGESQRARVEAYVHNQKEHHRQQTTNYWLERMDETDEPPPDEGLDRETTMVSEQTAEYEIDNRFP